MPTGTWKRCMQDSCGTVPYAGVDTAWLKEHTRLPNCEAAYSVERFPTEKAAFTVWRSICSLGRNDYKRC